MIPEKVIEKLRAIIPHLEWRECSSCSIVAKFDEFTIVASLNHSGNGRIKAIQISYRGLFTETIFDDAMVDLAYESTKGNITTMLNVFCSKVMAYDKA